MEPLWNISNPSDPYTLKTDDHLAAALAIVLLGNGAYPLDEIDGTRKVPPFFFGGEESVTKWLRDTFATDKDLDQLLGENRERIATVLDTVLIGSVGQRRTTELALEFIAEDKRADYLARVHDERRTSMNDIGSRAAALAKALRVEKTGAEEQL